MESGIQVRQFLADLTPAAFEQEVAKILAAYGFVTRLTPHTGDYGADILAQRQGITYVVEVKQYASGTLVGRPELQKLQGARLYYRADAMIFVTFGHFSHQAHQYAKRESIRLIDGDELVQMFIDAQKQTPSYQENTTGST